MFCVDGTSQLFSFAHYSNFFGCPGDLPVTQLAEIETVAAKAIERAPSKTSYRKSIDLRAP